MEEERQVKCIIETDRIFFPKGKSHVKGGEYGIFSALINEKLEGCEALDKKIKLKGIVCELNYEDKYKVTCKLADVNEKFGDTYEIIYINRLVELKDKHKQRNFLMTILNETTVNRLYDKFDDVLSLLENEDIKSLISIKGIGTATAIRMIEKYNECKDYSSIYAELGHLGFSNTLIKKLVDYYNSPDIVIDKVKTNPYELVNVDGIGFKKADEIADKVGISGSNPNRVKGCILYILAQNGEAGRSYVHFSELLNTMSDSIGYVENEIINKVAMDLVNKKEVYVSDDGQFVGLNTYYKLENDIAKELGRLINAEPRFIIDNLEESIKETEEEQGFEFTIEQRESIKLFNDENVFALTGGAGCGKTSTANGMAKAIEHLIVTGVALSGKASLRLEEATGIDSSTIHRLLGFQHGEFMYNEKNKLDVDGIIIDEATMIDGRLFLNLLKAIPNGAKVVMLGDVQQLTAIGSCQVFADVLNSKTITSHKLTKPHRQALMSGIIPTSMKVINQEQIFPSSFEGNEILGELQDMELEIYKDDNTPSDRVVRQFMKHYKLTNDLMETQVIVPMKNRGDLCTYNLNLKIQNNINPINTNRKSIIVSLDKDRFYTMQIGDKIINRKNNYNVKTIDGDDISVFNGNMGIIKDIVDGMMIIDFIGIGEVVFDSKSIKNLELAYAITVHSSQGSGFKVVIGAIDSSAYMLLNAELLYTLLTRAKKYCVLVGKNQAIRTAINKREVKNKQTYLCDILNRILI